VGLSFIFVEGTTDAITIGICHLQYKFEKMLRFFVLRMVDFV